MCSISLVEGINHLSATKLITLHYPALSDSKLFVLFLQMYLVDLFAALIIVASFDDGGAVTNYKQI